jgi:hypothetical protein
VPRCPVLIAAPDEQATREGTEPPSGSSQGSIAKTVFPAVLSVVLGCREAVAEGDREGVQGWLPPCGPSHPSFSGGIQKLGADQRLAPAPEPRTSDPARHSTENCSRTGSLTETQLLARRPEQVAGPGIVEARHGPAPRSAKFIRPALSR